MSSVFKEGLEDIVVSTSEICFIDGREGRLLYRGYDVDDLVQHASFEEVVYLLWNGSLPSRKDLETHVKALSSTANRKLPPKLVTMLRQLSKKTTPMEVLRTGVSALSSFDPDAADNSREATTRKAIRLTAQMPTLVAAWERLRRGKTPVAPNPKLSLAGNFVYMMTGKKPTDLATKTFDVALILHADHEFNASTFAARVTAATLSDLHSAIVSGIGALKGPLHGGANEQVMRMVEQIKTPERADAWIRKALADKPRIMGFGHRVYRVEDPRAKHLRRLASWRRGSSRGLAGALRVGASHRRTPTAHTQDRHRRPAGRRRPARRELPSSARAQGHAERGVLPDRGRGPGVRDSPRDPTGVHRLPRTGRLARRRRRRRVRHHERPPRDRGRRRPGRQARDRREAADRLVRQRR